MPNNHGTAFSKYSLSYFYTKRNHTVCNLLYLISFSIIFPRFMYYVQYISTSLVSITEKYFIVWIYHSSSSHINSFFEPKHQHIIYADLFCIVFLRWTFFIWNNLKLTVNDASIVNTESPSNMLRMLLLQTYSYIHNTTIRIRKLTLTDYYHLIFRSHSSSTNYSNNILHIHIRIIVAFNLTSLFLSDLQSGALFQSFLGFHDLDNSED